MIAYCIVRCVFLVVGNYLPFNHFRLDVRGIGLVVIYYQLAGMLAINQCGELVQIVGWLCRG